jgi:hypothetical protein
MVLLCLCCPFRCGGWLLFRRNWIAVAPELSLAYIGTASEQEFSVRLIFDREAVSIRRREGSRRRRGRGDTGGNYGEWMAFGDALNIFGAVIVAPGAG